jgi:hypothetical protein
MKLHTDEMGEISGFGGGYEECCREMLQAGVKWLDEHPQADPKFRAYSGVYGLVMEDNPDGKQLTGVVIKAAKGEATGAMHHAVIARLIFIKKAGWEEYVKQCIAEKNKEITT